MEEDAGKLNHDPDRPRSRVDLNRTGVPLIEIVSEPDIRSPEAAGAYLRLLRAIVRYLGICDGNMEEGSFRCDANVSIRPEGAAALGTRAEIKNLNSFKHVEKALAYEIQRQTERMADGGHVIQETRLWDPDRGRTHSMRGKEEAHDYRYFPDPDLLPLIVDDAWIASIRAGLPELPQAKKERFMRSFGLSAYDAERLSDSRELADYFEACVAAFPQPKAVSNWILGSLLARLHAEGREIDASPVSAADLAALLKLIDEGTLSGKIGKTVFEEMAQSGRSAATIVQEKKLVQVSDKSALEELVVTILGAFPAEVAAYRGGKTKLLGFFVGQVMQATRGKANPKMVNEILEDRLKEEIG